MTGPRHTAARAGVSVAMMIFAACAGCHEERLDNTSSAVVEARAPRLAATAAGAQDTPLRVRVPASGLTADETGQGDLFATTSWFVAPVVLPAPKPVPQPKPLPAAPVAPALPFRYLGQYLDGDRDLVMLVKEDRLYTLAVGDIIDDQYQVVRIGPARIDILYLPLKLMQSLITG